MFFLQTLSFGWGRYASLLNQTVLLCSFALFVHLNNHLPSFVPYVLQSILSDKLVTRSASWKWWAEVSLQQSSTNLFAQGSLRCGCCESWVRENVFGILYQRITLSFWIRNIKSTSNCWVCGDFCCCQPIPRERQRPTETQTLQLPLWPEVFISSSIKQKIKYSKWVLFWSLVCIAQKENAIRVCK